MLGALAPDEIDAEFARAKSARGEEGRARAWSAMYAGNDLSAYLYNATAQGSWAPEQRDLVAG